MENIKRPSDYDWTEFTCRPHGFRADWCRSHHYTDGKEFNLYTVSALVTGAYISAAGPKITEIIRAALAEGLIHEIDQQKAA